MRYQNFVIQVTAGGYHEVHLRVSESPVGESATVVAAPQSPLGRLLAGNRTGELDGLLAEGGPERLGQLLHEALFCGPIRERFLEAVGRAGSGTADGLRIKLQVDFETEALAEVHALPWELLYRAETGFFLALDRRFAVVRHLRLPVARDLPTAPDRLKLLVAVAVPRGRQPLETEEECQRIAASWRDSGALDVRFLAHATLDRLRSHLLGEEFHGLHFMGHGQLDSESGDGLLLLEDDRGEAAPCSGRDLAIQLGDRTSLRWVFLNACSTGSSSTWRPFGGLAAALLRTGIPTVLAMQQLVTDRAALVFSHTVYQRLAAGDGIDTAVSEGRLAIHRHLPGSSEWATPVLFLRSADGDLFDREGAKPAHQVTSQVPDTGVPAPRTRARRWVLGAALVLTGLAVVGTAGFYPFLRSHPEADLSQTGQAAAVRDAQHVRRENAKPPLAGSQAIAVGEGKVVEVPEFGARVSVSFDDSLGTPFARLTVAFPDRPQVVGKPFMGPTTLSLGEGRGLAVQSIDWTRREILILPIRSD